MRRRRRRPPARRVPPVGRLRRAAADRLRATPPTPANWRRVAHIIADVIYSRMTGEKGYFDTRIVYVAETGPQDAPRQAPGDHGPGRRQPPLPDRRPTTGADAALLADAAGDHLHVLRAAASRGSTSSTSTPGSSEVLGNFPGMTFAPRFSPDGNARGAVAWRATATPTSTSMDLRTRALRRLTNHPGDRHLALASRRTAPQIVFNSDRGGDQQLYVMDADGCEPARITFGSGRYATPVWSPRGDLIAFTRIDRRQLRHRRDAAGRHRRAHPGRGLPRRGPDLGAERPRADVLPREPLVGGAAAAIQPHLRRSTSPASTSASWSRRPTPRIPPGRRSTLRESAQDPRQSWTSRPRDCRNSP